VFVACIGLTVRYPLILLGVFCRAEALSWQTPIAMIRYVIKLLLNCDGDILAAKLSWAHGPDNGKEREY